MIFNNNTNNKSREKKIHQMSKNKKKNKNKTNKGEVISHHNNIFLIGQGRRRRRRRNDFESKFDEGIQNLLSIFTSACNDNDNDNGNDNGNYNDDSKEADSKDINEETSRMGINTDKNANTTCTRTCTTCLMDEDEDEDQYQYQYQYHQSQKYYFLGRNLFLPTPNHDHDHDHAGPTKEALLQSISLPIYVPVPEPESQPQPFPVSTTTLPQSLLESPPQSSSSPSSPSVSIELKSLEKFMTKKLSLTSSLSSSSSLTSLQYPLKKRGRGRQGEGQEERQGQGQEQEQHMAFNIFDCSLYMSSIIYRNVMENYYATHDQNNNNDNNNKNKNNNNDDDDDIGNNNDMKNNNDNSNSNSDTSQQRRNSNTSNALIQFAETCLQSSNKYSSSSNGSNSNNSNSISSSGTYSINSCSLNEEDDEKVMECWALLRSAFPPPPPPPPPLLPSSSNNNNNKNNNDNNNNNNNKNKNNHNHNSINNVNVNANANANISQLLSHQLSISPKAFTTIQQTIARRHLYPITVHHPLYYHIENTLLTLNEGELVKAMTIIDTLCQMVVTEYNQPNQSNQLNQSNQQDQLDQQNQHHFNIHTNNTKYCNTVTSDEQRLLLWRKAVHIAQLAAGSRMNHNVDDELRSIANPHGIFTLLSRLKRHFVAFDTHLDLEHSCVPNCTVEAANDDDDDDDGVGGGDIGRTMAVKQMRLAVVALSDIDNEQYQDSDSNSSISGSSSILTISKIGNLHESIEKRALSLKEVFGKDFICNCVRCRYERKENGKGNVQMSRNENDGENNFTRTELKNLGDQAMQQGLYKKATAFYNRCLKDCDSLAWEYYGDTYHALCASILEQGMFMEAQRKWKEAKEFCPNHNQIETQAQKQKAYQELTRESIGTVLPTIPNDITIQTDSYEIIIPAQCYMTKEKSPVISPEECESVIKWAETAAQERKGGWTTSRHYAVPTTDIPIHEVPTILKWFNNVLVHRLRPLLALQFGEQEVGKGGCNVHIHDAFVVRYDAMKQRHLPLHCDQANISFTIALNESQEYKGGGTFIAKINKSLRPSLGGALSFRGDQLLHGGDPLIRGKRYIIVAFCYVCKENSSAVVLSRNDRCNSTRSTKRRRMGDILNKGESGEQLNTNGAFSFGFKL